MTPKLLFIVGPTAIGKTGLAINLAKQFNCEIISADSRQFYKDIPIGTAAPDVLEQNGVPHHFIGHLELEETWSAAKFSEEAKKVIANQKQKDLTIVVGGSGFYLHALEYELDDIPDIPPTYRENLNIELEEKGLNALQKELQEKDPDYYAEVDLNNPQRVIRALEVIRATGQSFSKFRSNKPLKSDFEILKIGLELPREILYDRINKRVDIMLKNGMLDEAKKTFSKRHLNSLNTVGFKELYQYLSGNCSIEEAVEEIKKNTRRFAKRQITWFKRTEDLRQFHPDQTEQIISLVKSTFKLP